MARRSLIVVTVTLLAALALAVIFGQRVLERDREQLFAAYGQDRARVVTQLSRDLAGDLGDIAEDLELASTLVVGAASTPLAERELHAIATIKREYLAIYALSDAGELTSVTAFDAPPGVDALAASTVRESLGVALSQPGVMHISTSFSPSGASAWYRVFARRPHDHGPTVAVVIDMSIVLGRRRMPGDSLVRTAILDGNGLPSPISEPALVALLAPGQPLASLVEEARAGHSAIRVVDGSVARSGALPATTAVGVGAPLSIEHGQAWVLVALVSAQSLQAQERVIARRVLVGGGLVMLLLLSAAAYVIHTTFRARELRERVRHTERLATLLDHIPSGVLALSSSLRVLSANRWLGARVGTDIIGRALAEAFPAASRDEVALVLGLVERARAAGTPQTLHREAISLLGGEATLNIHAVPLALGIGDVSTLLVFDDLSEVRRIEQRLLHSEKLVTAGQLAAGIAHEIGTPLNVARGRVELSLSHLGREHAEADNQRLVLDQIDRVTRLIQQLLDYVRPAPAVVQSIEVTQSFSIVCELLAAHAAKRKVTITAVAEPTVRLHADPDQVQQILVNLAINAIDACEADGHVELRARRAERVVVVEVVDDGQGIPRELKEQVFDPFFTTKKRGQGTGLGLWVVAQLVRAQSAEIEIDSVPQQGTTVRITWPDPP